VNLRLEYFKPLFHREIPILVHTQGYQVIQSTLRILHDEFNLKVIIGHACFDSYKLAEESLKRGIPVMSGPAPSFRLDNDTGQIHGIVAEYAKRGVRHLGVNTDAPVFPKRSFSSRQPWPSASAGPKKRPYAD